jgi:4-hydroxybenzoate polyprenyltransferase
MAFAFLLSFIREIIKDIEDQDGDRMFGCQTLPIVKGIQVTRSVIFLVSTTLFILLFFCQLWLWNDPFKPVAIWLTAVVEIPAVVFLYRLKKAEKKEDYHFLSSLVKWIMVGGIASMGVIFLCLHQ